MKMIPENISHEPLPRLANERHLVLQFPDSPSWQASLSDPSFFSPSNLGLASKNISQQISRQTATRKWSEFPCEWKPSPRLSQSLPTIIYGIKTYTELAWWKSQILNWQDPDVNIYPTYKTKLLSHLINIHLDINILTPLINHSYLFTSKSLLRVILRWDTLGQLKLLYVTIINKSVHLYEWCIIQVLR